MTIIFHAVVDGVRYLAADKLISVHGREWLARKTLGTKVYTSECGTFAIGACGETINTRELPNVLSIFKSKLVAFYVNKDREILMLTDTECKTLKARKGACTYYVVTRDYCFVIDNTEVLEFEKSEDSWRGDAALEALTAQRYGLNIKDIFKHTAEHNQTCSIEYDCINLDELKEFKVEVI